MKNSISTKSIKILVLGILFITFILYLLIDFYSGGINTFSSNNEIFKLNEKKVLAEYSSLNVPQFFSDGTNGYFYITKDGVKYFSYDNIEQSAGSFNMSAPISVLNSNKIAIFEHKGYLLYVFSDNGELYQHQFDMPILNASINNNGYCSVITQNNDSYNLYVFNDKGEEITTGVAQDANIFPIYSSVSNNNKILAVSFIDMSGININSKVIYVSLFAKESIDYKDGIIASSASNPDEIISQVKFIDNNRAIIISDKRIKCVDTQNDFKDMWEIEFNNKINSIDFDGSNGFVIAFGDSLINKKGKTPDTIAYYDFNANIVWEYLSPNPVTYIKSGFGSALVGMHKVYMAINEKGKPAWTSTILDNVSQMFFYQNINNIIQVSDTKTSIYSFTKTKKPTSDETIDTTQIEEENIQDNIQDSNEEENVSPSEYIVVDDNPPQENNEAISPDDLKEDTSTRE